MQTNQRDGITVFPHFFLFFCSVCKEVVGSWCAVYKGAALFFIQWKLVISFIFCCYFVSRSSFSPALIRVPHCGKTFFNSSQRISAQRLMFLSKCHIISSWHNTHRAGFIHKNHMTTKRNEARQSTRRLQALRFISHSQQAVATAKHNNSL